MSATLAAAAWRALAEDPARELLALWGEPGFAHAAWLDGAALRLARTPAVQGRVPALSPARPGAILFERALHDLWGIAAAGALDPRPFLDHGSWPLAGPLAARPAPREPAAGAMRFLPATGPGLHEIPLGPIHAGIAEPGHFRFQVQGERVLRLEVRLGYTHKGTLALMRGKPARAAARFAARLSGDSTVAHSLAFARAAEAALGLEAPPRARALRRAMLECERLHNHLHDLGMITADAGFAPLQAECGWLREALLVAQHDAFGHRLMMDRVAPGGVAAEVTGAGLAALGAALGRIARALPGLLAAYDAHASLQDRVQGTGRIPPALVAAFAAGGVVGRAAGRGFDARALAGELDAVPTQPAGDVDARWRQRHREAVVAARLAAGLLAGLPEGPLALPLPARGGEGVALVEGFRGECLAWLRLEDGGLIEACFLRDPSWLHWPLLEAAAVGASVADFPLINRSINASCSGVDL